MKLLAIETSTEACSAALLLGNEIQSRYEIAPQQHANLILPMVNELLAQAGIKLQQLDAIAFGRGPGSFTGVRIAASVTQGLAFGADVPVIPVSTLAAIAQHMYREQQKIKVLAAIDARISEVYWAAYELDNNNLMQLTGEECVIAPDSVAVPEGKDWFGAGTGWSAYLPQLQSRTKGHITGYQGDAFPHAEDIIALASPLLASGQVLPPEQAIPVYLRDNVAIKKA